MTLDVNSILSSIGTTGKTGDSQGVDASAILAAIAKILPNLLNNAANQDQSTVGLDTLTKAASTDTATTTDTASAKTDKKESSGADISGMVANVASNIDWSSLLSSFGS